MTRRKVAEIKPSGGWWFARGSGTNRNYRPPVEAATAGDAIRKMTDIDNMTLYGPYGSAMHAWAEIHKFIAEGK